ncbi:MAG: MinD/ParA family protein [Phycisphaerales bacterium]|nr:MinD/ParA family protein [Phycisphaerales bacterium]
MTTARSHARAPVDQASALRLLMRRAEASRDAPCAPAAQRRSAHVITISSGKGGVGKTNIAVNLCIALTKRGRSVTMLDADLGLANADVICGLSVSGNLSHVMRGQRTLDEIQVYAPGGFRLIPGASGVIGAADASAQECIRLIEALDQLDDESDVVVIDTGAGNGRSVTSFLAIADRCLVVTTPEPPAIADAYALIKAVVVHGSMHGDRSGRVSLVVNQARDATEARRVYARIAAVAQRFLDIKIAFAGWLPDDAAVRDAVRRRMPFYIAAPKRRVSAAMDKLAEWADPGAGFALGQAHRTWIGRVRGVLLGRGA